MVFQSRPGGGEQHLSKLEHPARNVLDAFSNPPTGRFTIQVEIKAKVPSRSDLVSQSRPRGGEQHLSKFEHPARNVLDAFSKPPTGR